MRIFGIDGGIASIGWAVLDIEDDFATIVAAGVRMFDAPETDKERTPTNAVRRLHRGQRRVICRRRQRMAALRALFQQHDLLDDAERDALKRPGLDPWRLRAEALERRLTGPEFAVALGHIARHRGFRSNAKREAGANAADETSKMKKAIAATQERLGQWQTVGLMFARDPEFAGRKHNRGLNFDRSIQRSDHEFEYARCSPRSDDWATRWQLKRYRRPSRTRHSPSFHCRTVNTCSLPARSSRIKTYRPPLLCVREVPPAVAAGGAAPHRARPGTAAVIG